MRHRAIASIAAAAVMAASAPAFAHDGRGSMPPGDGPDGGWHGEHQGSYQSGYPNHGGYQNQGDYDQQRDMWLAECRHRMGSNGVTGAVIGGVLGGVAGHEIAGRNDRLLGTVAGGVIGAVAGRAIEKAGDRGRANDRCEAMLQGYGQQSYGYQGGGYGNQGYGNQGYGYAQAYAVPMMMVPVMMVPAMAQPAPSRDCKEVVTTEYVTTYETVRRRVMVRRPVTHYKRVPVYVPEKRVRIVPDKRIMGS